VEEDVASDDEGLMSNRNDDAAVDMDNAVPSDVQGLAMTRISRPEMRKYLLRTRNDTRVPRNSISAEQLDAIAEEGQLSQTDQAPGGGRGQHEQIQDSQELNAFKKLGDALERWHRQQRQIRNASRTDESHSSARGGRRK
jgi:midasin